MGGDGGCGDTPPCDNEVRPHTPVWGATLAETVFGARYPRGLPILRAWSGQGAPTGDVAA